MRHAATTADEPSQEGSGHEPGAVPVRKVAVNRCHGGFSLSPAALLRLHERGVTEIADPVAEYYGGNKQSRAKDLADWRAFVPPPKNHVYFVTVFSPDERFVLYCGRDTLPRDHPELVRVIEEMGDASSGACAKLAVTEIPADVNWHIEEYDGLEWIAEDHRTW